MKARLVTLASVLALGLSVDASAQMLFKNRDFSAGLEDWITAYNQYNAAQGWISYQGLPAGPTRDGVMGTSGNSVTLSQLVDDGTGVIYTELFVYQEFTKAAYNFQVGDTIHFTGSYSATVAANPDFALEFRLFIKANSPSYDPLAWSVIDTSTVANDGPSSGTFDITLTIDSAAKLAALGNLQAGVALFVNDANDRATITLSNLEAWLNDDKTVPVEDVYWAGYLVNEWGYADTGEWLGVVYPSGNWVWIDDINCWAYMPESLIGENGAWCYIYR